ncbi:hypothetical protein PS1_018870 [Malus domestica]
MSLALVGMGAFRTAFEMLFDAVKSVQGENKMFQHLFRDIKFALDSVQPLIKDIEKYNSKEGPQNFAIQMEEGASFQQLLHNLSGIPEFRRNVYRLLQ